MFDHGSENGKSCQFSTKCNGGMAGVRRRSRSPAKRVLTIGRTCFHNLTEYNEIMDSA